MERLFVYGTLRPGHSNAHIMDNIGGEWQPGYITGTFYERGWGAAADFPGIVLDKTAPGCPAFCFCRRISRPIGPCWMRSKRATIALLLKSPPMRVSE